MTDLLPHSRPKIPILDPRSACHTFSMAPPDRHICTCHCLPVDHFTLVLDEHGNVHEHLVKLLDALLQLDEHLVPKQD